MLECIGFPNVAIRFVIGFALLGAACGGTTVDSPSCEDAGSARGPITSIEALEAAVRAQAYPEGARLVWLQSSGGSTMDAAGRDSGWTVSFWDRDGEVWEDFYLEVSGRELRLTVDAISQTLPTPCDEELATYDTETIVPDAVRRLEVGDGAPLRFRAALGCARGEGYADEAFVMATTEQGYRIAMYDDAGSWLRNCGPCNLPDPAECEGCFP